MRICVNRESLMPVLAKVGGVVERRQTLPILGNLLISAEDDSMQLTGTDLEIEVHAKSSSIIEQSGEITLPARKLIEICRALPEGTEMTLRVEKDRASLVAGRSRFMLSTMPASNFPIMERNEEMQSKQTSPITGSIEDTPASTMRQNSLNHEIHRGQMLYLICGERV